jgi:predicted nucleic acid-binding protein
VALIGDSGALYALYDRRDRHHRAVREAVEAEAGPIVLPAAILAELDYLLRVRLGHAAELRLLEGIQEGAFAIECFTLEDAAYCRELLSRYEDLDLGLADAAVIATAERLGILRILTVDERDFRAVRTSNGKPFILLPADSLPRGGSLRKK